MTDSTAAVDGPDRGIVEVWGDNLLSPPLVSTGGASRIVVRDSSGVPVMFLQRLVDDTWALFNRLDDDWAPACERFGGR